MINLINYALLAEQKKYGYFNKINEAMVDGCGDGTLYQPESGSPWMGEKMIHKVVY